LRAGQHHGHGQALGLDGGAADDLVEEEPLHAQVIVGRQLLGHGLVVLGLRFTRVGDGGRAHLEVALGRCQLLGDGLLVGLRGGEHLARIEHIEVGLRQAHDQVLLGQQHQQLRGVQPALGAQDGEVVGAVEQGVLQRKPRLLGARVAAARGGVGRVRVGQRGARAEADVRPVGRAGLLHQEGHGVRLRAHRQQRGVVVARGLVELGKALRLRGAGTEAQGQHRGKHPQAR